MVQIWPLGCCLQIPVLIVIVILFFPRLYTSNIHVEEILEIWRIQEKLYIYKMV